MCPINQRQYGKKLMKRLLVVTDPEGGSKKYWLNVCTYKKSTLKKPWRLITRDLNCSDIDCSNNHAKSKESRLLELLWCSAAFIMQFVEWSI